MPTCDYCGDEIEFRYLDGRSTPIHVNGGWCSGHGSGRTSSPGKPFQTVQSYLNPNALCPVCGAIVYFYLSPFGGKVFFDNVGWPWPKHPCTDNQGAKKTKVKLLRSSSSGPFRNAKGELLTLHKLVSVYEERDCFILKFSLLDQRRVFQARVAISEMKASDITLKDLQLAPSFAVRTYVTYRILEFMSGRKKMIDSLKVQRLKPPV